MGENAARMMTVEPESSSSGTSGGWVPKMLLSWVQPLRRRRSTARPEAGNSEEEGLYSSRPANVEQKGLRQIVTLEKIRQTDVWKEEGQRRSPWKRTTGIPSLRQGGFLTRHRHGATAHARVQPEPRPEPHACHPTPTPARLRRVFWAWLQQ